MLPSLPYLMGYEINLSISLSVTERFCFWVIEGTGISKQSTHPPPKIDFYGKTQFWHVFGNFCILCCPPPVRVMAIHARTIQPQSTLRYLQRAT